VERLCFLVDTEVFMVRRHEKTMTGRIFENILFLEEVFGDKGDEDIPDVPVLELANALNCLTQDSYALPEDGRSVGRFGSKARD
jgi:hypothetical protein